MSRGAVTLRLSIPENGIVRYVNNEIEEQMDITRIPNVLRTIVAEYSAPFRIECRVMYIPMRIIDWYDKGFRKKHNKNFRCNRFRFRSDVGGKAICIWPH